MTNDLHIAVIGAPGLASVLERSGRFYKVWRYQTTGQLREGIKELSGLNVPKLTFLFADNTPNDIADMSFGDLIGKLTQRSYRVVLVECSGVGRDVVATNPGAGLIPAPITCNLVLGAISDRGAGMIEPVGEAWGFEAFNPNDPSAVDHLPASDADLFGDLLGAFGSEELGLDSSWESGPATSPVAPAAPSPVAQVAPAAPWEQAASPVAQVAPWEQAAAPVAQVAPVAPWEQAAAPSPVAQVAPWEQAAAPVAQVAPVAPWEQASAPSSPVPSAWDTAAQSWGEAAVVAPPVNDAVGLTAMPTPSVVGGRKGIVLAVTVAKGGAGKSSLTLNLGVWAALKLRAAGRTVCIVDANWQQADIGKQINQYTPNIATLSKNPGDVNAAGISKYMYRRNDLNTSFLLGPADDRERNPTWITSDLYCKSIEALRELYDYIFVDTPVAEPYHELFSNFILQEADYLIVPVNPSWPTLANTESWLDHITLPKHASGEGFNEKRIGVVLNRAEDGVDMSESDVQSELGRWCYLGAVPDSKEWRRAANNNEIIATRNIPEISQAFSRVLYSVLGEEALRMDIPTSEDAGGKKRGWRRARS